MKYFSSHVSNVSVLRSFLLLSALATATCFATANLAVAQTAPNTSNGSSTGVGNAGSFGIGSGTANGNATATATSNGVSDSNNTSSARFDSYSTSTDVMAGTVTLSDSSLSQSVAGIPASAGYNVPDNWRTGDIAPASITNSNGVVVTGSNTGVASNLGVVTSITPGTVQTTIGR